MDQREMDLIVDRIYQELKKMGLVEDPYEIPVELSNKHVHLTTEDIRKLFGKDTLTWKKDLSQPGQFAAAERVTLVGPKGRITNVAVLGPARSKTQVELSLTDANILGVKPPIRESGKLDGSADICIETEFGFVNARESTIIAQRHIHMLPEQARRFGVTNGEIVDVRVTGTRPLVFGDVIARVSDTSALAMHIDFDEGNAAGCGKDSKAEIIKK